MLSQQVESCLQNIDLKELKQQTLSSNNLVIIMRKKIIKRQIFLCLLRIFTIFLLI